MKFHDCLRKFQQNSTIGSHLRANVVTRGTHDSMYLYTFTVFTRYPRYIDLPTSSNKQKNLMNWLTLFLTSVINVV